VKINPGFLLVEINFENIFRVLNPRKDLHYLHRGAFGAVLRVGNPIHEAKLRIDVQKVKQSEHLFE